MARRRTSPWAGAFQRSLTSITRSALRAGSKALQRATREALKSASKPVLKPVSRVARLPAALPRAKRAVAAPPRKSAAPGSSIHGIAATLAGSRQYALYRPPALRRGERLPLLVMLHGCRQDATGFAQATRMNRIAAKARCFVLYPEQSRIANPQACWNWYDHRTGRGQAEVAIVCAAIDQVVATQAIDPGRIAIAGLSAGASLAARVAAQHPARFKAVVMHSGIAPTAAHSPATALSAMRGRRQLAPLPQPANPADAQAWPALLVIQGTADAVVANANGAATAQWWADVTGARPTAARAVQRGRRHPMQVTEYRLAGRTRVRLCEVRGLGHAWSGGAARLPFCDERGPDASRLLWSFVAAQFGPR